MLVSVQRDVSVHDGKKSSVAATVTVRLCYADLVAAVRDFVASSVDEQDPGMLDDVELAEGRVTKNVAGEDVIVIYQTKKKPTRGK